MVTITDVGPTPANYVGSSPVRSGSGRVLCICVAADGERLYCGCYAGVWRSDDGGRNWRQMVRPQPGSFNAEVPGALFAPYVIDIAVSQADPDIVLVAAEGSLFSPARNGIYRSADGGQSWRMVVPLQSGQAVSQVVFAPDDPSFIVAPLGRRIAISTDAGQNWTQKYFGYTGNAWHAAIAPLEAGGIRRIYAAGDNRIWRSIDAGQTWLEDLGTSVIRDSRKATSDFITANSADGGGALGQFAGRTDDAKFALSVGSQALAIAPDNPQQVFLATLGGTYGPSFYAKFNGTPVPDGTACNTTPERLAGEGSLWFADFSNFDSAQSAAWQAVPGPPVYWGTTTPSGKLFLFTKPTPTGYQLFFADNSHVHVSVGRPLRTSAWRRLDGRNASEAKRANVLSNVVYVHPDPHGLAASPDFDATHKVPTDVPSPYNDNSELDTHIAGTLWMANDGGIQWSDDGGLTWNSANGLHTCDAINIAGLAKPDEQPALYIGTGDNDSFFTTNGGETWKDCYVHLGDADAWFADIAQSRVLQFSPRAGEGLQIFSGNYPDAGDNGARRGIPTPSYAPPNMGKNNLSSGFVQRGSSPMVRTLATELPPADGDYVVIMWNKDDTLALKRTLKLSQINAESDWDDPNLAVQIGPALPAGAVYVQASGGHLNPAYYVTDNVRLWKLDRSGPSWRQIVPGGPSGRSANSAIRFYVDPFNPDLVYIKDTSTFRISLDGGESWLEDQPLTQAMTGSGLLDFGNTDIIRDMLFLRGDRFARFALGGAGVMYTLDGITWQALLNAIALPGLPESGFFDGIRNPLDRTLYVEMGGRSILRLSGVPAQPPVEQGLSGLEIAAILHEA